MFCALLAFNIANATPLSKPLSNDNGNNAQAQTILHESDNNQIHPMPVDVEIPLNIRIQLVPTERQQQNGNKGTMAFLFSNK